MEESALSDQPLSRYATSDRSRRAASTHVDILLVIGSVTSRIRSRCIRLELRSTSNEEGRSAQDRRVLTSCRLNQTTHLFDPLLLSPPAELVS